MRTAFDQKVDDLSKRVWAGRMDLLRAGFRRVPEDVFVAVDSEFAEMTREEDRRRAESQNLMYVRFEEAIHYPVVGDPNRIATIYGIPVREAKDLAPGEIRFRSEVSL